MEYQDIRSDWYVSIYSTLKDHTGVPKEKTEEQIRMLKEIVVKSGKSNQQLGNLYSLSILSKMRVESCNKDDDDLDKIIKDAKEPVALS